MSALENVARLLSAVRGLLVLVGLMTVLTVAWPASREFLLLHAASLAQASEMNSAAPAGRAADTTIPVALEFPKEAQALAAAEVEPTPEQRAVAEFIARRYRVAQAASTLFVRTAYRAGSEWSVDPLLILAVMAIESRYNPVAESSMGAKGLMQVIPRFHPEKLLEHGGEHALLDPEVNIQVGTEILREYMRRFGETEAALQKYAGALDEPTAQYAGKVLAEKARLQQFLARALHEA
ncbi:MAG: transglycosylase SLT domain-containing protein [Burkholderiales bacterium]